MAGEQKKDTNQQINRLTKPFHVHELENYLDLNCFLHQFKRMVPQFSSNSSLPIPEGLQFASLSKQQIKGAKNRLYNCTKVSKSKKWMKNILVDDSDSNDSDFDSLTRDILEDLNFLRDRMGLRKDITQSKPSNRGEYYTESRSTDALKILPAIDPQIESNQPIQPANPPSYQVTLSDQLPETILETEPLVEIKSEPPNPQEDKNLMTESHSFLESNLEIEQNSDLNSILHKELDIDNSINIVLRSDDNFDSYLAPRSRSVSERKSSVEFEFKTEPESTSEPGFRSELKLDLGAISEVNQPSSPSDHSFSDAQPSRLHRLLPQSDQSLQLPVAETITAQCSCPETEAVQSFVQSTKRIRLDSKMLDEIQYDTTLPDEILQSELSSDASETAPSFTPSISEEVNFVNQLSNDTFNTDSSSGSVLSQCASQPAHCVSGPAAITQIKCMTAPTTPTNSRPNSPSMVACSSKSRKVIKTKSSLSHEINMTVKRRKIWISIARKEIPRAQKRRSSIRKKLLANCREISRMVVPDIEVELADK